jgi:hypothetical protein
MRNGGAVFSAAVIGVMAQGYCSIYPAFGSDRPRPIHGSSAFPSGSSLGNAYYCLMIIGEIEWRSQKLKYPFTKELTTVVIGL